MVISYLFELLFIFLSVVVSFVIYNKIDFFFFEKNQFIDLIFYSVIFGVAYHFNIKHFRTFSAKKKRVTFACFFLVFSLIYFLHDKSWHWFWENHVVFSFQLKDSKTLWDGELKPVFNQKYYQLSMCWFPLLQLGKYSRCIDKVIYG